MTFLFKIEQAFEIRGRGRVIVPTIVEGHHFKIRPQDPIRLRTPEGAHPRHSHRFCRVLKAGSRMCRMGILLPTEVSEADVPKGTDVWLGQN